MSIKKYTVIVECLDDIYDFEAIVEVGMDSAGLTSEDIDIDIQFDEHL